MKMDKLTFTIIVITQFVLLFLLYWAVILLGVTGDQSIDADITLTLQNVTVVYTEGYAGCPDLDEELEEGRMRNEEICDYRVGECRAQYDESYFVWG